MVLIVGKVYANWCGHCQTLKPVWEKLCSSVKNDNTQFVSFEESEHDKRTQFEHSNGVKLSVNGYPTIFKISNRNVDYYSGQRSLEDMLKWVSQHSSRPPSAIRVTTPQQIPLSIANKPTMAKKQKKRAKLATKRKRRAKRKTLKRPLLK
jgi:thioredoxin-like negative regulator of GroEL